MFLKEYIFGLYGVLTLFMFMNVFKLLVLKILYIYCRCWYGFWRVLYGFVVFYCFWCSFLKCFVVWFLLCFMLFLTVLFLWLYMVLSFVVRFSDVSYVLSLCIWFLLLFFLKNMLFTRCSLLCFFFWKKRCMSFVDMFFVVCICLLSLLLLFLLCFHVLFYFCSVYIDFVVVYAVIDFV